MKINLRLLIKSEQGFSLIELIVAMTVSVILMVLITQIVTGGFTSYFGGYYSYEAQTDSIAAVQKIGKEVRQSADLISASAQSITIHEYVNSEDEAPSQVRFFLDGTELKRGEIAPQGTEDPYTYDPLTETVDVVSSKVVNGSSPIFTYYDQNNILLNQPVSPSEVTLVQIDMEFSRSSYDDPFPVSTKIQLRHNKTNL